MDNLSPDQIKQMINMLQAMLPKEEAETDNHVASQVGESTIRTVSPKQVSSKTNFVNKFDQMMEASLHKEDRSIDQALSVHPPTPRVRSFEAIEVVCRVCGKKDSVNASVISDSPGRYKCNNCARSPG
jgi:hypothetical protein